MSPELQDTTLLTYEKKIRQLRVYHWILRGDSHASVEVDWP